MTTLLDEVARGIAELPGDASPMVQAQAAIRVFAGWLREYDYKKIEALQKAAEDYTASGEDNWQGRWCHVLRALADYVEEKGYE